MNILILDNGERECFLPRGDRRADHILTVLRKGPGDELAAGCPDGAVGSARITAAGPEGVALSFTPEGQAPALHPVVVLLGFPRPIQARRILKDLASLGVSRVVLCATELGEKSYMKSDLVAKGEYLALVREGAEQSANPRLMAVDTAWTLARGLAALGPATAGGRRWCLDPYKAGGMFGSAPIQASPDDPAILAIGSERGWTPGELGALETAGFSFARLGERILKTETAATAAVAISLSRLGLG
ncbi:MAG TPA: RsmE family RNA methyltransferase [Spirochaetales bacterium]|nr:RsmE family RNA methyltransferase [Spirochaetales bacterium]